MKKKLDPRFKMIDLEPIHKALEDEYIPDLPPGPIGRHRLVTALATRYGSNFRIIPGARKAIEHFDNETKNVKSLVEAKLRMDQNGRK